MKLVSDPLHLKAGEAIINLMKVAPTNRLRSEEDLAEMLGVSRTTIRQAMNNLLNKGVLSKRKGKGNFLLKSVIDTRMRIDIFNDFTDMVGDAGYEPTLVRTIFGFTEPSEHIGGILKLKPGEKVLSFLWECLAEGKTAVLNYVSIPGRLVRVMPENSVSGRKEITGPDFFRACCNEDLSHYIIDMEALHNGEVCKKFGLPEDSPLICWNQHIYNIHDQLIGFSEIYFNPALIHLKLVLNH